MIECHDLAKRFGGVQAVRGVAFRWPEGMKICGLIGPNGSGKTTLFNLISGFVAPDRGSVTWRGRDVTRVPAHRRAHLGLVRTFQQTMTFTNLTVRENLALAGLATRAGVERVEEVALLTGVDQFWRTLARDLPFGTARRLGVALALLARPQLLLLDEPAAGLNEEEAQRLSRLIRSVTESGVSVFLIEHDMSFLMPLCEFIVVMDSGLVIAEGTPTEVVANENVVSSYLGVEA
jgi:branched-chain amino acid transport system ATP-binding protein